MYSYCCQSHEPWKTVQFTVNGLPWITVREAVTNRRATRESRLPQPRVGFETKIFYSRANTAWWNGAFARDDFSVYHSHTVGFCYCYVLTYGPAILGVENEVRHVDFKIAYCHKFYSSILLRRLFLQFP